MIAEVPSRIAFATSDASARVGSVWWIIDSSICVAVITGRPRSSAREMMRFWSSGTSAVPISTPRSPRATMTASDSARISSSAAIASAFSIFAITCAVEPRASISVRSARTSEAERTNESATKSTPSSSANSRSSRSLRVIDGIGKRHARQVDALVRGDDAADDDLAARPAALDRLDAQLDVPVVDEHVVADLEHGAEHGGADREVAVARRVLPGDDDGVAALERDGLGEVADAELRALQVGDQRDRPAGRRLGLAHALRPGCGGRRGCRATC